MTSFFNHVYVLPGRPLIEEEINRLRDHLLQAVFEYDELIYKDCLHLNHQFFFRLGEDYLALIEAHYQAKFLEEELILIQKYGDDLETLAKAKKKIDERLKSYRYFILQVQDQIAEAEAWAYQEELPLETSRMMRRYYREILAKVHPLLHPVQSQAQKALYQKALSAYRRENIEVLDLLWESLKEDYLQDKTRKRLTEMVDLRRSLLLGLYKTRWLLALVRSDFPYRIRYHVLVDEHCEKMRQGFIERRKALEEKIKHLDQKIQGFESL